MIKLQRAPKPQYLTDDKVKELTDKFKVDGTSVWSHEAIKTPLLESSSNKCAYCECNTSVESKYMEVEHFLPKEQYKDNVVDWENLLPSCKRCNIAKSKHDPKVDMIVDPYNMEPKAHLAFRLFRLKGKTLEGKNSIGALDLNNTERLVHPRFQIGQQIEESIEASIERLQLYMESKSTVRKNRLIAIIETILNECQPSAVYSAITASVALTNANFLEVISETKQLGIWEDRLEIMLTLGKNSILDNC